MSLFHLFSKPKVERSRGYAEQGLVAQPISKKKSSSKLARTNADLNIRPPAASQNATTGKVPEQAPVPSTAPSHPRLIRTRTKAKATAVLADSNATAHEPPRLAQALKRATRHGRLELCTLNSESFLHRARNRSTVSLDALIETKASKRMSLLAGGAPTYTVRREGEKEFVLLDSGILLQYAADGSADRLPERSLLLGKDSNVSVRGASPGHPSILQVTQSLDDSILAQSASSSIFSKMSLRGASNKRIVSTLSLVAPDAASLDAWAYAIQERIAVHSGSPAVPHSATPSLTTAPGSPPREKQDDTTSPHSSPAHRNEAPAPLDSIPEQAPSPTSPDASTIPALESDDESDTATLDGIELEASKLDDPNLARIRTTSDATSRTSSPTTTLEKLRHQRQRDSSTRVSHSSTINTITTSRTSSLTSTPPTDRVKPSLDIARESGHSQAPYRSVSSQILSKRRSFAVLPSAEPNAIASGKLDNLTQQHRRMTMEPVYPAPRIRGETSLDDTLAKFNTPRTRLTTAQSVPDLKPRPERASKRDSKIPPPINVDIVAERPVSFVADLPSPITWTSRTSAGHRASIMQQMAIQSTPATPTTPKAPDATPVIPYVPMTSSTTQSRRMSRRGTGFSIPLKINPQQPTQATPPRRTHRSTDSDVVCEIPVVHTLSAKVDFATRTTISTSHIPPRRSSSIPANAEFAHLGKVPPTTSARLSLFPSASPPIPMSLPITSNMAIKRSPSAMANNHLSYHHPQAQQSSQEGNATSFRRPMSLQVTNSQAPFLASVRAAPQAPVSSTGSPPQRLSTTTVPIRSLKPSRPNSQFRPRISSLPVGAHQLASLPQLREPDDQSDITMKPERSLSPPLIVSSPPASSIRSNSSRRISSQMSGAIPRMDFGLPIAALGPPQPPPSMPLPQVPRISRSPSPGARILASLEDSPTRPRAGLAVDVVAAG